jgi:hypothetical protein
MVEAFSIRGLGLLASSWEANPPFINDSAFGQAIRRYREAMVDRYRASQDPAGPIAAWFAAKRTYLESPIAHIEGPAVVAILGLIESDAACIEDYGAVNRWPQRSGLKIEDYLTAWQASCVEVGAPGVMPARVRALFGVG